MTSLAQFTAPADVHPALRDGLIACWIAVTNAGGAAGFPYPPVGEPDVAPVADALVQSLAPDRSRLLVAQDGGTVAGWVHLHRDPGPLTGHWATVRHLQTHPAHRGRGIGAALMNRLREIARDDLGLAQLHLAVRGGTGLERYYARLGWHETGRWPGALRFDDGDRDEVLMLLDPL